MAVLLPGQECVMLPAPYRPELGPPGGNRFLWNPGCGALPAVAGPRHTLSRRPVLIVMRAFLRDLSQEFVSEFQLVLPGLRDGG